MTRRVHDLRVLVDALPLRDGGGVTYLEQQLPALDRVSPETWFHTLVSPWSKIGDLPGTVETVHSRSVPTRFAYEQARLPFRNADLLYCPANFGPVFPRKPMVITIHNAHYYRSGLALPDNHDVRPSWKVLANHSAMRSADAVIAISQAQADEVVATIPRIGHKLHVIPSGRPDWPATSDEVADLPEKYMLLVTSSAKHKRTHDVVEAWARAMDSLPTPISLVVVGGIDGGQAERHRDVAGTHSRYLIHLGPIYYRSKMKRAYERASVMVSMSELESFPLTPVEAGSVGCPMILSDIPPHREVTCGNGWFVPVGDVPGLARLLVDQVDRWEPGSRPWQWPTTWEDNARQLQDVFASVRNKHRGRRRESLSRSKGTA